MQLSIASLKDANAFTGKPVKKVVEYKGSKFDCYVRPMSYQVAISDIAGAHAKSDFWASRIAGSICDKDGAPVFSVADITGEQQFVGEGDARKPVGEPHGGLDGALVNKLIVIIGEVQNAGKTAG